MSMSREPFRVDMTSMRHAFLKSNIKVNVLKMKTCWIADLHYASVMHFPAHNSPKRVPETVADPQGVQEVRSNHPLRPKYFILVGI